MTTSRRRNPAGSGATLRDDAVSAADRILDTDGIDAVGLRAVAREVGVTAPALYAHFADRDALVAAVIARQFEALAVAIHGNDREDSVGDGAVEVDPEAVLRARVTRYARWAAAHPRRYAALFGDAADHGAQPYASSAGEAAFRTLSDPLGAALGDRQHAHAAAVRLWAEVHGTLVLRAALTGFPWPPLDEQIADAVSAALSPPRRDASAGLRPPPTRASRT